jgi:hypothetical protein
LADSHLSGQVHYSSGAFKRCGDQIPIEDGSLHVLSLRIAIAVRFAVNLRFEDIEHADRSTSGHKTVDEVRADEAGSARDENCLSDH